VSGVPPTRIELVHACFSLRCPRYAGHRGRASGGPSGTAGTGPGSSCGISLYVASGCAVDPSLDSCVSPSTSFDPQSRRLAYHDCLDRPSSRTCDRTAPRSSRVRRSPCGGNAVASSPRGGRCGRSVRLGVAQEVAQLRARSASPSNFVLVASFSVARSFVNTAGSRVTWSSHRARSASKSMLSPEAERGRSQDPGRTVSGVGG
jgi:hypothetical protein